MPKQTKISFNLDGLEDIRRACGDQYIARVGILGSKGVRNGTEPFNNAEIGLVMIFGSVSRNIPPRDFLLMPIETKKRELVRGMESASVRNALKAGQFKKIFQILGVIGEGIVDDAFASGGFGKWPALKDATIKAKGSSAILIDTAQLRRSITSDVVKKGSL